MTGQSRGRQLRRNLNNLMALTTIQASNALIPLLIVPFVLSRVGAAAYAPVVIAEAVSTIALATVLFSFEIDGVAQIAGLKVDRDRAALSYVLSGIIAARLALFICVGAALLVGFTIFTHYPSRLLMLWLLVPLGQVFHSYWFYQGIEQNRVPAILTLSSRAITLIVVILAIKGPEDAWLIPLAIGAPFVGAGLLSLAYKCGILGLNLEWVGVSDVAKLLRHGSRIFFGNGAVMMYREMNVLLLSIAGVEARGIAAYALVEKTVKMLQACTRPLNQLFFPKLLRALSGNHAPNAAVAWTIARYTLPQLGIVSLALLSAPVAYFVVAPHWLWLASFETLPHVGLLFVVMMPAALFGLANFMFGSAGLNFLNDRRYQLRALLFTGTVSIIACLLLARKIGVVAGAGCFLGAEALQFGLVFSRYLLGPSSKPEAQNG